MELYAGVDFKLILCQLQSRLQYMYTMSMGIGQPYARVDLNPIPETTSTPRQGLRIWPSSVFTFEDYQRGLNDFIESHGLLASLQAF